ncbi:PQQ-dependent sugar dehydrogenase [Larkinella soli]|uniref:PQQ-dependent sugar dehydrogenase n=1 Tax=Larkinella soli TaxID=1770527 RepID=UPI000FFC39E4|nr:PQQ-dependent sugar dehydrogenase [Larkinella soli]
MKLSILRTLCLLAALAGTQTAPAATGDKPSPAGKAKRPADEVGLKLPAGFSASILTDQLPGARHLVVTKTGDIYVKLSKLKDGKGIYRLRDTNRDGVIDEQTGFGDYPGTGIFVKNGYLYASSNTGVYRYQLNENQEVIRPEQPEQIVKGLVAKDRDLSKSIAIDNASNVYVNVASYNDACRQAGTGKGMMPCPLLDSAAGIWRFRTDKLNQTYGDGVRFATGLKNVVGLDWNPRTNTLFVMQHGRGQFHDFYPQYYTPKHSAELPAETMYELHEGADGGWPYVYYDHIQKKKILAPEYGGDGKKTGGEKTLNPVAAFPAHMGPNGLLFYTGTQFPEKYRNGAFIAFHGQSQALHKGYLVAFVPFRNGKPAGPWEIFADNFAGVDLQNPSGPIQHRPCGLAQGPDGSLYVTDDLGGAVYRITYRKK